MCRFTVVGILTSSELMLLGCLLKVFVKGIAVLCADLLPKCGIHRKEVFLWESAFKHAPVD